jgi:polysulfide reductase chain C
MKNVRFEEMLPATRKLNFNHEITRNLISLDVVIIVAELLIITTLIISYALQPMGEIALGAIITGGYYLTFWIGIVLLGLLVPLALAIMELQNRFDHSISSLVSWVEPALVLFGGFLLRYVIVYGGQLVYPILTFYR